MDHVTRAEAKVRALYPDMRCFDYEHLPIQYALTAKPICDLARLLDDTHPINVETSVALRKLLEAKDAAVRALVLYEQDLEKRFEAATADFFAGQPDEPAAPGSVVVEVSDYDNWHPAS